MWLEALQLYGSSPLSHPQGVGMPGQNRSPQVGLCTNSCSSRDENQTGCWCWDLSQGFDSFVLLHLWFWGEIQLGAERNYKHRLWLTQEHHGSLWERCKPSQGRNPRGSCSRDGVLCSMGQGSKFLRQSQTFALCRKYKVSGTASGNAPCVSMIRQKSHTRIESCFLWPLQARKKLNLFIPGMGRNP